jgi:hypothetical protein
LIPESWVSISSVCRVAEGEEVVFYGADPVQPPAIRRDALGELGFHGLSTIEAENASCMMRSASVMAVTWPVRL